MTGIGVVRQTTWRTAPAVLGVQAHRLAAKAAPEYWLRYGAKRNLR